jgi:hypothetical protein
VLNADGLHHLRYSEWRERSKQEQMLKFHLLPLALEVIRKAGTVQEYRRIWQPVGAAKADGMREGKDVEYWGFVAIIGPRPDKIRVIVRRFGTGKLTLWSVMRGSKILRDGNQRLAKKQQIVLGRETISPGRSASKRSSSLKVMTH